MHSGRCINWARSAVEVSPGGRRRVGTCRAGLLMVGPRRSAVTNPRPESDLVPHLGVECDVVSKETSTRQSPVPAASAYPLGVAEAASRDGGPNNRLPVPHARAQARTASLVPVHLPGALDRTTRLGGEQDELGPF